MRGCSRALLAGFATAAVVSVSTASAQGGADAETARGIALGTGARASASSTSSLAYGVAGLPLARLYHVELSAGHLPELRAWFVAAGVVDSVSNRLAAGLGVRRLFGQQGGVEGWDGRLGLALPIGDAVAIGVTGRWIDFECSGQCGDDGAVRDGADLGSGLTLDASVLVAPARAVRIALLGYNLVDRDTPLAPTRLGGSAAVLVGESLVVGADVLADVGGPVAWTTGGGVEYLAAGRYPLRVGYAWEQAHGRHWLTGGAGYVDQHVGVDVGVAYTLEVGASIHAALRYFAH
ncbi:MAG: hypothetical protein NZ898_05345 [Myxococcota bacterium]|nr:hypothetical protein [Myxococcota bacterium]MDW8362094.1 hypothetical protein [Myxococcales bacterium]